MTLPLQRRCQGCREVVKGKAHLHPEWTKDKGKEWDST
jgi:hypothetical protein